MFGILPNSREDLVDKAFAIYRITDKDRREQKAKEFIAKHHNHWCKVEFLGVWDTVASLGVPIPYLSLIIDRFFPHRFHNFDLSESVKFARHAISIDEERSAYKPVFWNKLEEDPDGRMKQVWFCGVHCDVGGGYEQEKESDLSNIALIWMMLEAIEKGLLIHKTCPFLKLLQKLMPNPDGYMHDEQLNYPGKLFGRITRSWDSQIHGDLVIHESVFSRKKGRNNSDDPKYEPWILKMNSHKIEPWKKKVTLDG